MSGHERMGDIAQERLGSASARFVNREVSWLSFNERVMQEASNPAHPLLERVRFLSISASNLDEFFMVRVAGLNDQINWGSTNLSEDGLTAQQQMELVLERTMAITQAQQQVKRELKMLLAAEGIRFVSAEEIGESDRRWLAKYFDENVFPTLTPIAIDPAHPFPFLPNKSLTAVVELNHVRRKRLMVAVLPFPPKLPRLIILPGEGARVLLLEELVEMFIGQLFPGYEKVAFGMLRVLRDSDLDVSDEAEDLVQHFEKAVKERKRGHVIRLKFSEGMPEHLQQFVAEKMRVNPAFMVETKGMLGLAGLAELVDLPRPDLKFVPYTPRFPERISDFNGDCFAAIQAKDIVVHHPYESFDVVVQFLRQAAEDEDVISIKQTLYRTSLDSPIVKALIEAADSGKSVTAVVELRARFDEEANIRLARELERAGAQVVYGFVNLKTHAKVSLVTKRTATGLTSYVHFGTGNYHPITAKIYTDLSFFTCDADLTRDANMLFNYLTGYAAPKSFLNLAVSPQFLRKRLLELIYAEVEHAKAGKPAQIWLKMNSLVDSEMIDALYYAGQQGVKIDLIVRGICCLRAGIEGFSDNIRVKSIVGRFLEHSRVFCFGAGYGLPSPRAKVFISSADWMTRNLDHRVEYLAEMRNPTVHEQVMGQIMVANLEDDRQSWWMGADGVFQRAEVKGDGFSAHEYFMRNPSLSGRGKALRQKTKPPKLYKTTIWRKPA